MHLALNCIARYNIYKANVYIYRYERVIEFFNTNLQTFAKPFAVENLLPYFSIKKGYEQSDTQKDC